MLALCPSNLGRTVVDGLRTPYNIRGTEYGSPVRISGEAPVDGVNTSVGSREEEQGAHSDPSTLLLDRDRNPPTFQNDPCIGH
jgi:hypothetical protein